MIRGVSPAAPAVRRAVVLVIVIVIVIVIMGVHGGVVNNCAHLDSCCWFVADWGSVYLRAASTSAGCTICPVLFDQWFLVKLMTAAISVSLSAFHDGIAPLF